LYSRGNHDVRGALARRLPEFMPRALEHGYQNVLRMGPVGIVVLDTGEDKEGPQFYGDLGEWALYRERQRKWLEQAVKDPLFREAPHKIVFCHIPLRWKSPASAGSWCGDGDQRWSALLAGAGVKAVFSGHTHEFWHGEPTADRPFHQIVGGGPQTKATKWSPTPATVIQLVADEKALGIEVVEAAARTSLLSLRLEA
jgi:3',5'-cyclic AMP phosphodiesterase CpdA